MEQSILRMEGIHKSFGGTEVLNDVHFELKKGEVHALVGGNGAGKSTLMKIMTGVYTLDSGKIFIDNAETKISGPEDAMKKGIAMIFQELSLIQPLTVAENIFLGSEIVKNGLRDIRTMNEKTKEILKKLGIDVSPDTRVSDLSVGVSQTVEIAKALSKNAKILVLDEPTAALSDNETERLFELMQQLKEDGVSMVYISHRMNEILKVADSVTVLKDGKYVTTQNIADMTMEKMVSYMMGGGVNGGHNFEWIERSYDEKASDLLKIEHLKINDKINDINFNLKPGEILGLTGLMGSGRTEILETLFGLRKAQGGTVYLNGKEIHNSNTKEAVNNGFALIPEDRRKQGLVLMHSVKDNAILTIADRLVKHKILNDEKHSNALVNDNVKSLNIKTNSINKTVGLLSGGNQQKVVIAKWLNSNPDIIMLDEPTAGVDIGAKGEILNIIRQFADMGKGVLFVSSELSELLAVCDRIITIYNGKITGELRHSDIKNEEELQYAIQRG